MRKEKHQSFHGLSLNKVNTTSNESRTSKSRIGPLEEYHITQCFEKNKNFKLTWQDLREGGHHRI